eukprot:gene7763-10548_t
MFDPSQPPLIEETLLKKRRSLEDLALRRSETVHKQIKRKRVVRGEELKLKRPELLVMQKKIRVGSENRMKRIERKVARQTKKDFVPKQAMKTTVGFVVRVREAKNASKLIKDELHKLGLMKIYDAIFVKLDREMIARLKPLDSYLTYGFISSKSVDELIHRRAYTIVDNSRKPLSDNTTVENALAEYNIICLSDLSHEIYTVGENFEVATKVLCTFNLSAPLGQYEKKVLKVREAIEEKGGFLGSDMDTLLSKIL